MTTTALDTTNWVSYPFSVNGINFVSLLDPQGSFYPQVKNWPTDVFATENARMINELIGDPSKLSTDELLLELDRVNLGASEAIVALA
jgi:hypothetical protein